MIEREFVATDGNGRAIPPLDPPYLPKDQILVKHGSVSAETRRRILDRDGDYCGLCADIFGPFEIDHRTPVCRGGTHVDDNLWVLCKGCNQAKGMQTVDEFKELLAWFGVTWLR